MTPIISIAIIMASVITSGIIAEDAFLTCADMDQRILADRAALQQEQPAFLWHLKHATVGLFPSKPSYLFLPHLFSLHELAPKKGADIAIALVDTGVAAFDTDACKKHPELKVKREQIVSSGCLVVNKSTIKLLRSLVASAIQLKAEDLSFEIVDDFAQAASWYVQTKNPESLINFIKSHGGSGLIKTDGNLTRRGKSTLKGLIKDIHKHLEPIYLSAPYKTTTIKKFIPCASWIPSDRVVDNAHGTHSYGIITSDKIGIAPAADVTMIRAFEDDGSSSKSVLINAVKKAYRLEAAIVNLSLKIDDSLDPDAPASQELDNLLKKIPYVVVSAGNSTATNKIAYPARFSSVDITVGSFDAQGNVALFSAYEKRVGPHIIAPGQSILSTGIIPLEEQVGYIFLSGTSVAASLVTAFLALFLGEFEKELSHDEVLKIIYASTIQLKRDARSAASSLYGALDMRLALFVGHVMVSLKRTGLPVDDFDCALHKVLSVLFNQPTAARKADGKTCIDFRNDYENFVKNAERCSVKKPCLPEAIKRVADLVEDDVSSYGLLYEVACHGKMAEPIVLYKLPTKK